MTNPEAKADYWEMLANEIVLAEKIRELDLSAFGLHLRRFVEVFLDLVYERENIPPLYGEAATIFGRMSNPKFQEAVNQDAVKLLHLLRVFGNKCIHENLSREQTEECRHGVHDYLSYARGLLNWVSRHYNGQPFDLSVAATGRQHLFLKDLFLDIKLTDDQSALLDRFARFLEDDEKRIFLLKGYAGTGKTFLLKGIVEYLKLTGRYFTLAASTGKAARVMSVRTGCSARTVHSNIYVQSQRRMSVWEIGQNNSPEDSIFFVDEASMVGDFDPDGENKQIVFGSGKLLTDLVKYNQLEHTRRKIVFIGDPAQLPPVKMNMSPALNSYYLSEHFGIGVEEGELKQVVRQREAGGILRNATALREAIVKREFTEVDIKCDSSDVEDVKSREWVEKYLESCHRKINGESIVIAHSNAKVNRYNSIIRNCFFPGRPEMCPGDKVMIVQNGRVDNHTVTNGQFGLIRQVAPEPEVFWQDVKYRDSDNKFHSAKVKLIFRDVEVGFRLSEKESRFFQTKVLENILYDDRPTLSHDENLARWEFFKSRYPELSFEKPYSQLENELMYSDPYYMALPIKFGYAITGHKSQGSEWANVFVDANSQQNLLCEDSFRWLYTVVTRAKTKLFMIDCPRVSFVENLLPESEIRAIDVQQGLVTMAETNVGIDHDEVPVSGIDPNNRLGNALYRDIFNLLRHSGIEIESKVEYPWLWRYFFVEGKARARVDFHYNGKEKITSIQAASHDEFSEALLTRFAPMIGRTETRGSTTGGDAVAANVPDGFQRKLYDVISNGLKDTGVRIANVETYQWNDRYTFASQDEELQVDFYFNGKHQYTKKAVVGKYAANGHLYRAIETALSKGREA